MKTVVFRTDAADVSQSVPSSVSLLWSVTGPRSSLNPAVFLNYKKKWKGRDDG